MTNHSCENLSFPTPVKEQEAGREDGRREKEVRLTT